MSQDVIRRVLEGHCGRDVFFAMGVTDVDDKIIARAKAKYVSTWGVWLFVVLGVESDHQKLIEFVIYFFKFNPTHSSEDPVALARRFEAEFWEVKEM